MGRRTAPSPKKTAVVADNVLWNATEASLNIAGIPQALKAYEWEGKNFDEAWATRCGLEQDLRTAIEANSPEEAVTAARAINKWGFGTDNLPASCSEPGWTQSFWDMIHAWHQQNGLFDQNANRCLEEQLRYRGIGIARVSKWVSFIDQARFGIYDSRVSRALRHIEINGHRVFPIVPDRSRDRTWSREDLLSSKSYDGKVLAVAYATYLQLLQMLGERLHLPTAQVEMGLFVIGRTMPDPSEVRKPFDKELYAPRPGRPGF